MISKFFEPGNVKENIKPDPPEQDNGVTVKSIGSVFLVATNNLMVAFADVNVEEKKVDLLAKFVETENKNWNTTKLSDTGGEWKTQFVRENPEKEQTEPTVKSSAVVGNGDKIYYFSVNNSKLDGDALARDASEEWHINVAVGSVASEERGQKTINWEPWESDKLTNAKKLKEKLNINPGTIPPALGFGFVVKNKILLAIQGEGKEEKNAGKNVTVFFQLKESEKQLEELRIEPTGDCYFVLFLWEEQIVMTPTACKPGSNQNLKIFDVENEFKVSEKKVNFLQEFLKDKTSFVTTKFDTKTDVLLFTQQSKDSKKQEVYLWLTDGNRTAKVETIITGIKGQFDVSMLLDNNELFVLHNNYEAAGSISESPEAKSTYNLKRLPNELTKAKSIFEAWKNSDEEIKTLFEKSISTEAFLFTHGLVGFLCGNGEDNQYWKDEYFYENATVKSGTRVEKGFRFSGEGAGAKWLVGEKQPEDQPYNFADSGFTLVATLTIDNNENKKDNSVLGVEIKESTTNTKYNIGLWCNTDNKWAVSDGSNPKKILSATEKCVQEETYQVLLTMKNKHVSMYIDGKKREELPQNLKTLQNPLNIAHFYFGANITTTSPSATDESHVTVTNVLLYNRPFDEKKEINELKKYVTIKKDTKPPNGNTTPQGSQEIPTPLPQGTDEQTEKKQEKKDVPSPSRTEDGGVGGGGVRVFSLLLAVLCVSAPLLHL